MYKSFLIIGGFLCSTANSTRLSDGCLGRSWRSYKVSLEQARSSLLRLDYLDSLSQLSGILMNLLLDPHKAFECATAVASGCHLAAQVASTLGRPVMAVRLAQATSIFLAFDFQTRGQLWIDQSEWGIRWEDSISNVLTTMSAYQLLLDPYESPKSSMPTPTSTKMSLAVVSVCDYNNTITPLALLSKINKETYANRWDYDLYMYPESPRFQDVFTHLARIPDDRPPAWSKIDAVLNAMALGVYDWVMWMDCDSFFIDQSLSIERIITYEHQKKGLAVESAFSTADQQTAVQQMAVWRPTDTVAGFDDLRRQFDEYLDSFVPVTSEDIYFIASEDGLMLNTGVFLVKSHPAAFRTLQKVRGYTFNGNPMTYHTWWEQAAFVHLLSLPKIFSALSNSSTLSASGYEDGIVIVPQREINGYPPVVSQMLKTHATFQTDDYIVSFSGCRVYSSQPMCNMLFLSNFCSIEDLCSKLDWSRFIGYF